jgi:hypothetical protein
MTSNNTALLNWAVAAPIAPQDPARQVKGKVSFDDLIDINAAYDAHKADYEVKAVDFMLHDEGHFTIEGKGEYGIEDHALGQACARFGDAHMGFAIPRNYARWNIDHQPALYAQTWRAHTMAYDKPAFVRTYSDSVRAFMSDKYTHIDNRDVLPMLEKFINDKAGGRYELVRPYVGRDGMNIRIMFQNVNPDRGTDGPYGIGVVVRTGETGLVSPAVLPFIQRHACTNSTVWQEGGKTIKQSGNREYKLVELIGAIGGALGASAELLESMMRTRYVELPSIGSIIAGLAEKHDWGVELTHAVSAGTEGQETLFGLVNGLTYAAHHIDMAAPQALEMEIMAGKFATNNAAYAKRFEAK